MSDFNDPMPSGSGHDNITASATRAPATIAAFDPQEPATHSPSENTQYTIEVWEGYEERGSTDNILLAEFRDDFWDWTTASFQLVSQQTCRRLKETLMKHGIYLSVGRGDNVPRQFYDLTQLKQCPKWPLDELAEWCQTKKFSSYRYPEYNNTGTGLQPTRSISKPPAAPGMSFQAPEKKQDYKSKKTTSTPDGDDPHGSDGNDDDYRPPFKTPNTNRMSTPVLDTSSSKALTELRKIYGNDTEIRYGGTLYDILSMKLRIFYEQCEQTGVPENLFNKAYSSMLKDKARDFYYQQLAGRDYDFDQMIRKTAEHFHTPENQQMYLREWEATNFKTIIDANPGKDLKQCLEILIDKLLKISNGLSQNHNDYVDLAARLAAACRGVPACNTALMIPTRSFEKLSSNLHSAIGIWTSSITETPRAFHADTDYDEPEQYYTDRRYERTNTPYERGGGFKRGTGYTRGYSRGGNNRYIGNPRQQRQKACFVCKQPGCWSTKHTPDERQRAQNQWRSFMQQHGQDDHDYDTFILECEGIDEETNLRDQFLQLGFPSTNPNEPPTASNSLFHMTATNVDVDGPRTISILHNASTLHGLTGIDESPPDNQSAQLCGDEHAICELFALRSRYNAEVFQGIMPDTGAAGVSTAGEQQIKALQRQLPNIKINTATAGQHRVRFGDSSEHASLGTIEVPTPFGTIGFHAIPANTPFLLCIRDMDQLGIYLDNVDDMLVQKKTGKKQLIVRKWGHPWFPLDDDQAAAQHLTDVELRQLHRRFGHPAAERLYKVLERAGYGEEITRDAIAQINKVCHQCQLHGAAPGRFKLVLRDDTDFNASIIVDVMYLDGKPVLHSVDEATNFQAAKFLPDMTAITTWNTLRAMWMDTYVGPPDVIVHDAGTNFASKEFRDNAKVLAIDVHEVPVEAHNAVGKVERYHGPLRRAFQIIKADLPGTTDDHVLQIAIKAINDTAGPNGIVPTLLVFGAYPRMTDTSQPAPSTSVRANALYKAMAEVRRLKAARQVQDALNTRNGPNTLVTLNLIPPAEVRVHRENIGWTGPHIMVARDEETCTVDINGKRTNFRTTVVKPYYRDNGTTDIPPAPEIPEKRRPGRPKGSKNKPKLATSEGLDTLMTDYAHNCPDAVDAYLSSKEHAALELSTKLRAEGKIKADGAPFELSDQTEIEALISQDTFRFEKYDPDKHGSQRVFKSRLVREVKGQTTNTPYEKSRLVIQGHNDNGKEMVLTQSPTIQRASQRLIITLAPTLLRSYNMQVWLRDITQAYIQSKSQLQRTILAQLPAQIRNRYPTDTLMVVVKPLYGIAEAGTHWWATYFEHHINHLGMETSSYDPCLLISKHEGNGFGIVGIQTDDTLGLSDTRFAEKEKVELEAAGFRAKPIETLGPKKPLAFNGCILQQTDDDTLTIKQKKQGEKLALATTPQEYTEQRARGAYIASICQPEATFDLSAAAQSAKSPRKEDTTKLNKRIMWQMQNRDRGLHYIPVDIATAKLYVFVDGSFANNMDLSSQIGFVIMLSNEVITNPAPSFNIQGNLIHWSSTKCKRVTRSVLASEICAMAAGADMGLAIGSTLDTITNQLGLPHIPIVICTDSFSLYECLVKLGTTKEKRLMVDIMSLRQDYERQDIHEIRWIQGGDNPADAMTKSSPNKALETFITTNKLTIRIQGRVKRDKIKEPNGGDNGQETGHHDEGQET